VTKVAKGEDVIGKIAANNTNTTETKEESIRNARKASPSAEDRNGKVVKASLMQTSKTSKPSSSSSSDNKTVFFSGTKNVNQSQEMSSSKAMKAVSQSTTKLKATIKDVEATPTKHTPFIYYMTSLEKSHRNLHDNDYFSHIYREHFMQTFQAMTFCKFLKPVEQKVLQSKRSVLNRRETHKDKKTLVFDLDETLIHCNESSDMPSDVKLTIRFPGGESVEAGINVRPYALECLKELSNHFEIVVFTASHGCYANVVLDYLDPKNQYIHHRLFRESCVTTEEGIYIKDLRVLGNRNLQDVVIIDNAAYSFGYQIENGIPIIPFYDNKLDEELKHLIPYLKFLSGVKDLREINKQTFRLPQYCQYDAPDKVLEKLVFAKLTQ